MTPVLEVKNLTKIFQTRGDGNRAVDNVSFKIEPGEIMGLVGESGSGKSTIAKMVTHLTDVTEGNIYIEGEDITKARGAKRRAIYSKLQMVFQTPTGSFDPRRTLGDGICESLKNCGVPKADREERAKTLLSQCGLDAEFAERYPHQVSGGQCQRAAIARALACDPKIIILDEATSALDVTVQKQVMDLLKELQEKNNLTYLFICHNLALVQQFCDKVIVLYDGKIQESGTPDDVIINSQSEYTKRLVEAVFD